MMKRLLLIMFTLINFNFLVAQSAEEAVNMVDGETGFGVRAAGMGNAYTSVAEDYSAIYWNPAGLARIKQSQMYGSLYNMDYKATANYQENPTDDGHGFTKFNSFGIAYSLPTIRGSFVLAFGYQRVNHFDSYLKFKGTNPGSNELGFEIDNDLGYYGVLPFDRGLYQTQTLLNDGGLHQWSLGAAIDLAPNFSAGLSLNFYGGNSSYQMDYTQDDLDTQNAYDILDENNRVFQEFYYNYYDVTQRVSSSYSGFEAKLGAMWKFMNFFRAGGTITFPMSLTIKEDWSVRDKLSYEIYDIEQDTWYDFLEEYDLGSGQFEYIVKVPFKFNVGASFHTPLFIVSASADYRDYRQVSYEVPDYEDDAEYGDLLAQNKYFKENFRAVLGLSVGTEVNLFNTILLRGGFRYAPSPFKDADSKFDKKFISLGAGLNVSENVSLNTSYTFGLWESKKSYDYDWASSDRMITNEEYNTNKILFGATIHF